MNADNMKNSLKQILLTSSLLTIFCFGNFAIAEIKAGDPSLQKWLMPIEVPYPEGNKPNKARIDLGKKLFFDPRLSGDGNMSCSTCHSPMFGWSDALPTARGTKSMILSRASPVITNTAFNSTQMWDGSKRTLEDQAMGPMQANVEMNMDIDKLFKWLKSNNGYKEGFEKAYPGEGINQDTLSKAIASFERTIISNNSPFDHWIKGDESAMTAQQVNGFKIFLDENRGNCAACHSAPNFVDNGFHNLGLASYGSEKPDLGRYNQLPLPVAKGSFKTPTLRDTDLSAPYFHDGSAETLMDVMQTYADHGYADSNMSPEIKKINLNTQDMEDLVAFMKALTSPQTPISLPHLPLE